MKHLGFLLTIIAIAGCSSGSSAPATSVEASESGAIATAPMTNYFKADGTSLAISPKAFDKPFLLEATIQSQTAVEKDVDTLQSQIIIFKRKGDNITMLRSGSGHNSDTDFASDYLLAKFKITKEDASWINFDFENGMSLILQRENDYGLDAEKQTVTALEIKNAIVDSITIDSDSVAVANITQVLVPRAELEAKSDTDIVTEQNLELDGYRVTYTFSSYVSNQDFKKVFAENKVGQNMYFTSDTQLLPVLGVPVRYITRWDISKPIRYYYSANIPEEFVQAVKDGVLYWNKVFGREVLTIEKVPDNIVAPHPKLNLIQWQAYDGSASAYGRIQHDPMTGEIRKAIISITSGWGWKKEPADYRAVARAPNVIIAGLQDGTICNEDDEAGFVVTQERSLMAAQDEMRRLVAHEVGHTLGLRHNFAGSTASQWSMNETMAQYREYLKTGSPSKIVPLTSSVMDYFKSEQSSLIGYWIRTQSEPFSYDREVINWGYFANGDAAQYPQEMFCSDSGIKSFLDCSQRVWDGQHPLAERIYEFHANLENLSVFVAEKLARNIRLLPGMSNSERWQSALPTAQDIADTVTEPILQLRAWLFVNSQSVHVAYRDQEMTQWLDKQIADAGGFGSLFSPLFDLGLNNMPTRLMKDFEIYISTPEFSDNRSQIELDGMKIAAKAIFDKMPRELVRSITSQLSKTDKKVTPYRKFADFEGLESVLARWASYVILSTNGKGDFQFDIDTRAMAVRILKSDMGPVIDWESTARSQIGDGIIKHWEDRFGKSFKDIAAIEMTREQRQQLLQDVDLMNALQ
ncbi:MAG: hypothetical protein COV45_03835 [Deltaproteobacteria bacterium CG11_big_fil_rev_8_21_14_0_20_47_16]|nr:MAG: hypothetical protein COV45_03835 [Deltaproteobacteria bacterium CG11_big_fil_rev_8_21_14_0_20_47_16]